MFVSVLVLVAVSALVAAKAAEPKLVPAKKG